MSEKVFCTDCKYLKRSRLSWVISIGSSCTHPSRVTMNHVTGEETPTYCSAHNYEGDCDYWAPRPSFLRWLWAEMKEARR